MTAQTPTAQQPIDAEFSPLACILADCQPDQLLAVAWRDDELVVIVAPGTKHVFTAKQVFDAGWTHGQLIGTTSRARTPSPRTPRRTRSPHSRASPPPTPASSRRSSSTHRPTPPPPQHRPPPPPRRQPPSGPAISTTSRLTRPSFPRRHPSAPNP